MKESVKPEGGGGPAVGSGAGAEAAGPSIAGAPPAPKSMRLSSPDRRPSSTSPAA